MFSSGFSDRNGFGPHILHEFKLCLVILLSFQIALLNFRVLAFVRPPRFVPIEVQKTHEIVIVIVQLFDQVLIDFFEFLVRLFIRFALLNNLLEYLLPGFLFFRGLLGVFLVVATPEVHAVYHVFGQFALVCQLIVTVIVNFFIEIVIQGQGPALVREADLNFLLIIIIGVQIKFLLLFVRGQMHGRPLTLLRDVPQSHLVVLR